MTLQGGLLVGNSHERGGIPLMVVEDKRPIEVEGHEYLLCRSALMSDEVHSFVDKTNKEILDQLFKKHGCTIEPGKAHVDDHVTCKLAVLDNKKRNISGTVKEILNIIQAEKGCKLCDEKSDSPVKESGGSIPNQTQTKMKTLNTGTIITDKKNGGIFEIVEISGENIKLKEASSFPIPTKEFEIPLESLKSGHVKGDLVIAGFENNDHDNHILDLLISNQKLSHQIASKNAAEAEKLANLHKRKKHAHALALEGELQEESESERQAAARSMMADMMAEGGGIYPKGLPYTKQDVRLKFRDYGEITIPKGVKLTHRTATGYDENYAFVDQFDWIAKDYPSLDRVLTHDAKHYGIDIPKEYVTHKKESMAKGGSIEDERISEMASGYMQAILFAENDSEENSLDANYSIDDFAPKSLSEIKEMCKKFISENEDAIEKSGLSDEQIGMDIWYTQAGHGAGFFDHGLDKDVEGQLEESAEKMGRFNSVEVGDDGKIYVTGIKLENGGSIQTMAAGGTISYPKERLTVAEQSDEERELELYVDNDGDLYRQRTVPIHTNLVTKIARGTFDINLAPKIFKYLIDDGIKKYSKEHGTITLSKAQKDNLAKEYTNRFLDEAGYGNYENYLPKKYQPKKMAEGGNVGAESNPFAAQLQEKIKAIFPESYVSVKLYKGLGDPSFLVRFTIGKDKTEYANGIVENDNCKTTIWIYGADAQGNPTESMRVESRENAIFVKPTEKDKYMAYGRLKTGWRNFTGTPDQVLKKLPEYFEKLKKLLLSNLNLLTDDTRKLVESKYGKDKMSNGGVIENLKNELMWIENDFNKVVALDRHSRSAEAKALKKKIKAKKKEIEKALKNKSGGSCEPFEKGGSVSSLITLTAKRVKETEGTFKGYNKTQFFNLDGTLKATIPASSTQPSKSKKTIVLNGWKYNLVWQ